MDSLRKLVAMLGGLAGVIGLAMAVVVLDWLVGTPEITASAPPADPSARVLAIGGSLLCLAGAAAIWRLPRLSGVALAVGTLGMVNGLGYTPFTLLPIGFAVVAAGLALLVVLNGEDG